MFSLIRKISSSQHPKDNMTEQTKPDDVDDKHEDEQQEKVDGTSYDPDADPRDPGRYYTFPQFAEDKQEEGTTQQSPGTPQKDQQATYQGLGTSDQDPNHSSTDLTTPNHTTPIKSTSPSSPEPDPGSPPFWPTSPLYKRIRSKPSSSNPSSPPSLERRSTTSSPSLPQLSRVQPCGRATGTVSTQHKSKSSKGYHSSPAARSLRSISAAQSPTRKPQQQKRLSAHSQGSPKRDGGKNG